MTYKIEDRRLHSKGYVEVKVKGQWVKEHRYVVEKFIGRPLNEFEVVHHLDSNRQNNDINNLMIFPNQKAHSSFHIQFNKFGFNQLIKRTIAFRWSNYINSEIFDYEKHTGFSKPNWGIA